MLHDSKGYAKSFRLLQTKRVLKNMVESRMFLSANHLDNVMKKFRMAKVITIGRYENTLPLNGADLQNLLQRDFCFIAAWAVIMHRR